MNMNILTLSTYPIDDPLHGGQHRLHNIVQAYKDAGHTVQSAGVLGSETYLQSRGFASYPGTAPLTEYIANPFLMDDWAIGELFAKNDHYFNILCECIENPPDLIHVEQPWLFQFAVRYIKMQTTKHIKILYGSQNIEHDMKFDIVKTYMGLEAAEVAQEKVLKCELAAIGEAEAICCVSQHDLDWTQHHTNVPCILAYNGVKERITTEAGLIEANKITGNRKFSLYSASAHPPNITGFFDIFGSGIGCIAPNELIVIAGSAGPNILSDRRFSVTAGLGRVCVAAGTVSEACLQGLLSTAHSIILPITHGGGTNLKTAEALWAGKHIIATTTAMRGFETYRLSQGVAVTDEPPQFLSALRISMANQPNILPKTERLERRAVLWSEILKSLQVLISKL
jgi:hypothetical protein